MVSRYNFYYNHNNQNIIYNFVSRKIISVSDKMYDALINSRESQLSNEEVAFLRKYDYLVAEDIDENLWLINEYYKIVFSNKLHLIIMASTGCNFDCKYCYEEYKAKNLSNDSLTRIEKFFRQYIKKYSGIFIEWFGGEPLLAKEQIINLSSTISNICRAEKKPYISSITTNGYLLDKDTFFNLIDSKICFFQVTIDGNKNTHDALRPIKGGGGTYDVIMNNLKNIKENIPLNRFFKIVLRNNIYTGNITTAKEFVDVFNKKFSDDSRFELYQYPIRNWGGSKIKAMDTELFTDLNIINNTNNTFSYSNLQESISGAVCYAAKNNGMVIDPECNIYKCSHYIQDMKCPEKCNKVGEIDVNGKINLDYKTISQWNIRKIDSYCMECKYLPYCLAERCPMKVLKFDGDCININNNKIHEQLNLFMKSHKG